MFLEIFLRFGQAIQRLQINVEFDPAFRVNAGAFLYYVLHVTGNLVVAYHVVQKLQTVIDVCWRRVKERTD